MSNTNNKPLTAEEIIQLCCEGRITIRQCAEQYAAQQTAAVRERLANTEQALIDKNADFVKETAALREELEEELKKNTFSYTSVFTDRAALREELEAVKKERDWLKEQFNLLRDKYSRIVPERDGLKSANVGLQEVLHNTLSDRNEAVKLLKSASDIVKKCNYPGACYSVPAILKALFDNNVNSFISRLSSGETKPDTCVNLASQLKKAMPETYPGKTYQPLFDHMIKEHNLTLLESEMQEIIGIVRRMDSQWISVEDQLPEEGKDYNFIVDIPHSDYHGRVLGGKYIGHRFGQHEFATPGCGYNATLYCPIPAPPESLTDK